MNMMKRCLLGVLIAFALLLTGCSGAERPKGNDPAQTDNRVNATEHGLSPKNAGEQNSRALQALIDEVSAQGGIVYIPAGIYEFAANGTQTIGSHCIKMRSNVSIVGDGEGTILKPIGRSQYGLDMFYFNDYLDTGAAVYLENCRFEEFVIDAEGTSCEVYTSAGKGFMFNLFKNCHFKNVTVKNTDATGFGVDCPIGCTIVDCTAILCGKAATIENGGASGFGIGFGYSEDESISIFDCTASKNKKFGFFLEHQGRFDETRYRASTTKGFLIRSCVASENLFGFGGICARDTAYTDCVSNDSLRFGFFFEDTVASGAMRCKSRGDGEACFAVLQSEAFAPTQDRENYFSNCEGSGAPLGVLVMESDPEVPDPRIEECVFVSVQLEFEYREA